uniref:Uncharacterized protein n=1 Tax=Proboscia inermis TaxID=420281 RepID=A0A7S0GNB3_9STRA
MEVGVIAVCVCCGKDVAELMVLENEFLQVELNGLILNHTSWDIWPEKKCVRLVSQHGNIVGDSGHSYLSLSLLEGNTQNVKISHVITI